MKQGAFFMKASYAKMQEMTEDILAASTILLDYIKNSDDGEVIKIRPIVKSMVIIYNFTLAH